jgi:hypothetical protein
MTVKINKPALNLREELNELNKPSGITGESLLRADTDADARATLGIDNFEQVSVSTDGVISADGLDVAGTATMDDAVISGSNPTLTIYETDTTNLNTRFDNGGGDLYIQTVNDDGTSPKTRMLIDHATGDINLGYEDTGATPKLFWDASAESLGIGVTDPAEKLQVNGNLMVGDTTTAGSFIDVVGAGASQDFGIRFGSEADRDAKASILATTTIAGLRFFTNGANERMRIDSSGNLLVGKTATGLSTDGTELAQGGTAGKVQITRTSNAALLLNRRSTDGTIADFRKDGTSVGSIGTRANDLSIGTGDTGLNFWDASNNIIPESLSAGAARDNAISLGASGVRFKDLYLSGGVYLGGTGSANKLDDYEEGTFTPSLNTTAGDLSGFSYNTRFGEYTKVGNVVTVSIELSTISAASVSGTGIVRITGLPFAVSDSSNGGRNCLTLTHDNRWASPPSFGQVQSTSTAINLYKTSTMNTANAVGVADMNATNSANFNIVTVMFSYRTA